MTAEVHSMDSCYNLLFEPFDYGFHNIQLALKGRIVTDIGLDALIARDALDGHGHQITPLSLSEKVTAFVLGALLFVPIINALVLALLKSTCANSNYLYPSASQPAVQESLMVNPSKIREAPDRAAEFAALRAIELGVEQAAALGKERPLVIGELLTQFDRICNELGVGNDDILYRDLAGNLGVPVTREAARRGLQERYIGFIQDNIHSLGQDGDATYYRLNAREMEMFLKGIIFELRKCEITSERSKSEITLERQGTAIKALCSAARHCAPRRHEEAYNVLRAISGVVESFDVIILRYIQEVKDSLFRNYYSLSTEPVMTLNYIRQQVGAELGLDRSVVRLTDIHMGIHNALSPDEPLPHRTAAQFRSVFHKLYTPRTILFQMKTFLNIRMADDATFAQEINQFIDAEVRKFFIAEHPECVGPSDVIAEEFNHLTEINDLPAPYLKTCQRENCADRRRNGLPYEQLTDIGVKFLMVHFGFLHTDAPGGHIVRAVPTPTFKSQTVPQ